MDHSSGRKLPYAYRLSAVSLWAVIQLTLSSFGQSLTVYHQNFELGLGGFSISNSPGGGLWHLSTGRSEDALSLHSPPTCLYYGSNETTFAGGTYLNGVSNRGAVFSPLIPLPAASNLVLSFHHFKATEGNPAFDVADVAVNAGAGFISLLNSASNTLPDTGGAWLTAQADLSPFAGQTLQLRFLFDTIDAVDNAFEGWFIDDVTITREGADLYEIDDTNATASIIEINGAPQLHNFHRSGDEDWIRLFAGPIPEITGNDYEIQVYQLGTNVDIVLEVFLERPDGTLTNIATVNDFSAGLFGGESLSPFAPPEPGFYLLRVTSADTSLFGAGSDYEVRVNITDAGETIVAIASDLLSAGKSNAPPGAVAVLDGVLSSNFAVRSSVPIAAAPGLHNIGVNLPPNSGYAPEEDPSRPGQVANPGNPLYGNPRAVTVEEFEPRFAAFAFVPLVRAIGTIRDQSSNLPISGARLEFTATQGLLAGTKATKYPSQAVYATNWATRADGSFPTNTILLRTSWDLTIKRAGYQDRVVPNAIVNPAAGAVINLGTLLMNPIPTPDLVMTQEINDPTPAVGQLVTFTLSVSNLGGVAASGVIVSNVLPAGLHFSSASANCTNQNGLVICGAGTLNPFQGVTMTITVTASVQGVFANTASAIASSEDPTPLNNRITRALRVGQHPWYDFDGDGSSDPAVYESASGLWQILPSSNSTLRSQTFGWTGVNPVPGDYDGDGRTDLAFYDQSAGTWYVQDSSSGSLRVQQWGWSATAPVPADYDGDGRCDWAVRLPASSTWFILHSEDSSLRVRQWGNSSDLPVSGDFDGDGRADLATYRPSNGSWNILQSSTDSARTDYWGASTDLPLSGDFDGDGRHDIAVYRPGNGTWYILRSASGEQHETVWGTWPSLDPVPADYDGDGRWDIAIYDAAAGAWHILLSRTGAYRFVPLGSGGAVSAF